jgi:NAD(P)-dependent dehydrogenase (short-subunit alcohol dehydrogenase family)
MMILQNKRVLISGATRGLGKSLVKAYEETGAQVISLTRKECDLNNSADIYSFIESVGEVDVLVNCAGVLPVNKLHDITSEEYNECIQVNLTAPFILTQKLSIGMVKRGWGRIINIASSSAYGGGPKTSIYCASKHALLGLSRSLYTELKPHGVRVICISPGTIKTDMGRNVEKLGQIYDTFMEPNEVARYIVYNTELDGNMVSEEIRLNRMFIQ